MLSVMSLIIALRQSGPTIYQSLFFARLGLVDYYYLFFFFHSATSFSHIIYLCSGEALTVQAPGTQTRSFCYVSDMVCKIWHHFLFYCLRYDRTSIELGGTDLEFSFFVVNIEGRWPYSAYGRREHGANQHWKSRFLKRPLPSLSRTCLGLN